jgi:hypothetical protein
MKLKGYPFEPIDKDITPLGGPGAGPMPKPG